MDAHRKNIIVCSPNDSFVGAVRLLLDDFEVLGVAKLSETPPSAAVLIYQSDGAIPAEALRETASAIPTLVLADPSLLIDSIDADCRGFLPSTTPLEQVRVAVETILDGGAIIPPELLGTALRHLVDRRRREDGIDLHLLTDREKEVFRLAAMGARKDEIGEKLFISPETARTHLQRVYRKLGVHSHAELVALSASTEALDREGRQ